MKIILHTFVSVVLASSFIFSMAHAQTNAQNAYISAIDQDLAIKSIVLVPTSDNVGGIYARPVDEELQNALNDDKQWSLAAYPKDLNIKTEFLDERPQDVKSVLQNTQSEAALATRIIRGPRGISITMTLFVGRDGWPLLQESATDLKNFETVQIRAEARRMFENIKSRMPFRGVIMSRRGQQVTLNLGSNYGLKNESSVSVVQIIKVNRHPKLHFMVSTEKEVLGRVRLFKVEPYLSFGNIEMEKEPGVISVGAKVMPDEFVKYAIPVVTPSGKILQDVTTRPDKDVAFGENPQEWLPTMPPQYGKIELLAGITQYTQNATLLSSGSISGSDNMAPNIMARGEFWLNPEWYVGAQLRQAVIAIENTLAGSSPSKLNVAMGQYAVNAGYNFLLTNDFFGPKLQVSLGYINTNFTADDSTPTAYTSMKYSGMALGLGGQFPISEEVPFEIGAKLDFYLSTSMSENKTSGSSSSNKINSFSFFGDYRMQPRFKIRGEILVESYSSDFNGTGSRTESASTVTHKLMTIMGGVQYLF
ncbi:hypothetical protein [Bdellovibrio bacteriovorus]|uniref:hypothetical protein n=1 Tax=Bdellovibrio bacteriovorus TaxID=959 RepID=UPI000BB30009|nr:hypothetical protein [Bdellovibrio bacteriovorus]